MTTNIYVVVRVNGQSSDTHAAETLTGALDLANADESDVVEFCMVHAKDAGAARLMKPRGGQWVRKSW